MLLQKTLAIQSLFKSFNLKNDMETTKEEFMTWAIDCMGYKEEQAIDIGEDFDYNVFAIVDKSKYEEVRNFIK